MCSMPLQGGSDGKFNLYTSVPPKPPPMGPAGGGSSGGIPSGPAAGTPSGPATGTIGGWYISNTSQPFKSCEIICGYVGLTCHNGDTIARNAISAITNLATFQNLVDNANIFPGATRPTCTSAQASASNSNSYTPYVMTNNACKFPASSMNQVTAQSYCTAAANLFRVCYCA